MTTIACDGKELAGDRLSVDNNGMPREVQKIFKIKKGKYKNCIIGGSGGYEDLLKAVEWFECGGEKPSLKDFNAILLTKSGMYRMENGLILDKIFEGMHAIGSGRDFAIAAMYLGNSAQRSVEIASKFNVYTGSKIDSLKL